MLSLQDGVLRECVRPFAVTGEHSKSMDKETLEEGSVGIVQTKTFKFAEPPNEMLLDCGRKLGPITLAYETYGELNEDKSNTILMLHPLSGDAHVAGLHDSSDSKGGWWDSMVGPGKAFDTNKYFVVCSNVLGGCQGSTGPPSINPETNEPYGLSFPIVTIGDMVRAQKQLLDHLGVERLLSVAGGSMGGMQALEWMTRYPDMLDSAMVIASTHIISAQAIAFDAVGRQAIQADPKFDSGNYYGKEVPSQGLSIARMLGHITYLSDESMRAKFGRALRYTEELSYDFDSEFSVETYLDYQGEQFVGRFDANSYLYLTKAIDYFDVSAEHGSLDNAMGNVKAKTLVLSYTSDWLYPPYSSEQIAYALGRQRKDISYCNIQSDYGHDAFLLEKGVMRELISGFLEHAHEGKGKQDGASSLDHKEEFSTASKKPKRRSIYEEHRVDYDLIVDLIEKGSRVLDVGCGNGELLCQLKHSKDVEEMGLELSQEGVVECVQRGVSVIQANVDKGFSAFPDQSFDYVILSMTLQEVKKPELVVSEMLRVGKKCIISFPNFAFWKVRVFLTLFGRAPVTRNLPYDWYASPNRHVMSLKDFRSFCQTHNAKIEDELLLSSSGPNWLARLWPNLFADEAVVVISSN